MQALTTNKKLRHLLDPSLHELADRVIAEEAQKSIEARAAKKNKKKAPRMLSDETVRQIRALKEIAGWKTRRIAEQYDLDMAYLQRVLSYQTRSKLVATSKNLPSFA